jgi:hypothetical protein
MVQLLWLAQCRCEAVTPRQQLLGQFTAEAAGCAGDEPGGGRHGLSDLSLLS